MLRQRPARAASFSPPVRQTLPRRGSTDLSVTKTRELFELAESLGFCVQKTTLFETELRHSMLKRMQRRRGQFVYQATAFSISGFARHAALSLLPDSLLQSPLDRERLLVDMNMGFTWRANSVPELRLLQARPCADEGGGQDSGDLEGAYQRVLSGSES